MFYPKNSEAALSRGLFENPTSEYRAVPFWSWNCELKKDLLAKQIGYMKEMGFGGYDMHPRIGLATPYLSDEFMDIVRFCVEKGKSEGMYSWLYDEDKWPSGYAGGFVTEDIEMRRKKLWFTPTPYDDGTLTLDSDKANAITSLPKGKYIFLAAYDVSLDESGDLLSYRRIDISERAEGKKYFAYLEYDADDDRFNGQAYVDTLKKEAIDKFIKVTHERYKAVIGDEFGKAVPAIFTDEPQFSHVSVLNFAKQDKGGASYPFTNDFEDTFRTAYGVSLLDSFPEVVWNLAGGRLSKIRYLFFDHAAERFAEAYSDNIGAWCRENNILMAGHVMDEFLLKTQTWAVGDCMRQYRGFGIPGIDMLADKRELTTAKQAQSMSRQMGAPGVLSELYGVTRWEFDFRGHKLQGDWQAAMGVTVRVPHLYWASMRGEAKRDYPASIGHQSPWYKEYRLIEDHFARVNTAMTRGKADVRIAVIHPIESFWLAYGPNDRSSTAIREKDNLFCDLTRWLITNGMDFDFICEAMLPSQYKKTESGFAVGEMKYDAVVVPNLVTLRKTTLDALKNFRTAGGEVVFMGNIPTHVDAAESGDAAEFAKSCIHVNPLKDEVLASLEKYRDVQVCTGSGDTYSNIVYQMRTDGEKKHLFIAHLYRAGDLDISFLDILTVKLRGEWKVTLLDTETGEISPMPAKYEGGNTLVKWISGACSSLLLELEEGRGEFGEVSEESFSGETVLAGEAEISLAEPNVLLLDKPSYSLNGGEIKRERDILYTDMAVRDALGIRRRGSHMKQPWAEPLDKNPQDKLTLYYDFESDIEYEGAELALECLEYTDDIIFNGENVSHNVVGYYIDEDALLKLALPKINKGANRLVINYRFGDITQLESCFILGKFGVKLTGTSAKITEMPKKIGYMDIVSQGMPFYGGNLTYKTSFVSDGGEKTLEITRYAGALMKVRMDGKEMGAMIYPPARLGLGAVTAGEHTLEITLFGNRANTFGTLHNVDENISYCGPASWVTRGGRFWCPEYITKRTGILTSPRILTK